MGPRAPAEFPKAHEGTLARGRLLAEQAAPWEEPVHPADFWGDSRPMGGLWIKEQMNLGVK